MKIVHLVLLTGILMLSPAEAGDKIMSKRVAALMSTLNVKEASDKVLPSRKRGALSALKFKTAGDLMVSHKQIPKDTENDAEDELVFSDDKGKPKAFGKIKYKESAEAAQLALFEELVMNSLPLNLLLERYEVNKEGPGDICIADKLKEKVHFIRGNVVVSINARDANVNVEELAAMMDEKLIAEE